MELALPSEAVSLGWEATEFRRQQVEMIAQEGWQRGRPRDDPSIGP